MMDSHEDLPSKTEASEPAASPQDGDAGLGFSPLILGILVVAAFALGFFGVYFVRSRNRPEPILVTSVPATANSPGQSSEGRLQPGKPDVKISSSKQSEPEISDADQQRIDAAIGEFPNGYDALEARDTVISMGHKAIESLTVALGAGDANMRMNAAMAISQIAAGSDDEPNSPADIQALRPYFDAAETVPALARLWDDPKQATRLNVCYALGNIGDVGAVPILKKMARDEDVDVRAGAAYSLGRLRSVDGIPTLVELLNDHDLTVRVSAVEALRPFETPSVKSALADRLGQETDPEIIDRIQSVLRGEPASDPGPIEGD